MESIFENINKFKLILLFVLGLFFYLPSGDAQITEAQAREMLAERGVPEDTLRARLIAKGYNPDNIAPDQLASFQTVILETIAEIEAEQKVANTKVPPAKPEQKPQPPEPEPIQEESPVVPSPLPTDHVAKIYGQEIFRNNSITVYQKTEDLVPSDTYILGTGDKLGVIGFGKSQFDQILEIGTEGFVQPGERLPKILLKGVRFGEAKELLYQRYSQFYVISRGEFQVTLVKPRNMTINVFGEAKTTGSFTLAGINTAFNVISAAGGPTDIGSVRRIKVIRGNETLALDVYEFMNDPGIAKNYFLQNNDYIHIPVAQKVIQIQGAVTRPMSYELLDHENLTHLIKYAGGSLPNAYLSDVKVTRYLEDRKIITNVNLRELTATGGDYILFNGDVVEIKSITDNTQNIVSIDGAVVFPDQYERREGMKISDLLQQGILKPDARLDFAYLLQYQPDGTYRYKRINIKTILDNPSSPMNELLSNQDMLQVMTLKTYVDPGSFSVDGAVKNPNTFSFNPEGRLKLEDAILLAGGLLIDASDFGYIMRHNPLEPKTIEYININLREALNAPASAYNVDIKAGDQILVYDKSGRRDDFTVSIYGAVRQPGIYQFGAGMNLGDLISLAGGFLYEADNNRIDVARSEFGEGKDLKITQYQAALPRDFESLPEGRNSLALEPFDHIYVRSIPEYEMQQTVRLEGELKYPGTYPLLLDEDRIFNLIERAGGLTGEAFPEGAKLFRLGDSTGLVVIELADVLQNKNIPSNIILRHGDVIHVPKSRDLVTIGGHVNLDEAYSVGFLKGEKVISVAYRGDKSAKYYIDQFAAGVSKEGSTKDIRVQYADGRVEKTSKFLFFNNYPVADKGATIIVGAKEIKPTVERAEKKTDWSSVLRDTMAQATAVLTLLILVDELSN